MSLAGETLGLNGLDALTVDVITRWNCSEFSTSTPTLDPDEGESAKPPTETPTPRLPECRDGIDNDGDGDIDMADGRCTSPSDDSESS